MKKTRREEVARMTDEEYQQNRSSLRLLVRTRENHLANKIAVGNRIGVKGEVPRDDEHMDDVELQSVEAREINVEDKGLFTQIWKDCDAQSQYIEKALKTVLRRFPIYNKWLVDIKGVGDNAAAWIVGEIDIRVATTVSKIWQFAGLNPGMMLGKKSIKKSDYKPDKGDILKVLPPLREGGERYLVLTNELVRGDRKTPGFVAPYNANLRMALCGRLGPSFIKAQAPYAMDYYYPCKARLEQSDVITRERKKGKEVEIPWSKAIKGHRHLAANRYMIKMFLKDLYVAWRTIEGLPVREPYAEEYLGKKHHASVRDEAMQAE